MLKHIGNAVEYHSDKDIHIVDGDFLDRNIEESRDAHLEHDGKDGKQHKQNGDKPDNADISPRKRRLFLIQPEKYQSCHGGDKQQQNRGDYRIDIVGGGIGYNL